MTGFEVAGLVLAVVPIVLSALENYKAGVHVIQRLYHWESQLLRLILSLKVQHAKFKLNLEKLVRAAAPDDNIQEVPEDYNSLLWHGNMAVSVKRYLGSGHEAFRLTIEEYEGCVKRLVYKLRHVNRPRKASKDDLKVLLAANPAINGQYSWAKRVDFTMKQKELAEMTAKLDQSNLTLSGFIADSDMLDRLQTQYSDQMQVINLAAKFQTVRQHAENLHEALLSARLPDCADTHKIALHLEDRITQKGSSGQQVRVDVSFRISVAVDAAAKAKWCQTDITVSRPQSSGQEPIGDLCRTIKCADHLKHSFHLLNNMIAKMKLSGGSKKAAEDVDTTTLAELLQCGSTIKPKDITILALKLACSLVQLGATGWLEDSWTKEAITFFGVQGKGIYHTSGPLISKQFPTSCVPVSSNTMKAVDTLFELGIMLMEVGYQKSFETWLAENLLKCVDNSRFARLPHALRWHENSEDLFPIKYRIVVAKCLKCSFDEYKVSWNNPEFRQAICRDIIEPLHQNASIW